MQFWLVITIIWVKKINRNVLKEVQCQDCAAGMDVWVKRRTPFHWRKRLFCAWPEQSGTASYWKSFDGTSCMWGCGFGTHSVCGARSGVGNTLQMITFWCCGVSNGSQMYSRGIEGNTSVYLLDWVIYTARWQVLLGRRWEATIWHMWTSFDVCINVRFVWTLVRLSGISWCWWHWNYGMLWMQRFPHKHGIVSDAT